MSATTNPIARFGLITDSQYVDREDGWDFAHVQQRRYRGSLAVCRRAAATFRRQNVDFVIQLGDIIDGKNVTECRPEERNERKTTALKRVLAALQYTECSKSAAENDADTNCADAIQASNVAPIDGNGAESAVDGGDTVPLLYHHLIGNHELYCWPRSQLSVVFGVESLSYRAFAAAPRLKVILLDSYQRTCIDQDAPDENEKQFKMLATKNPNDVRAAVDWVAGLTGIDQRWLPYNGGLGSEQLDWLRAELQDCVQKKQFAIVCLHVPIGKGACQDMCLSWDFEQALSILHDDQYRIENSKNAMQPVVLATFAGHDHDGGQCVDEKGILHRTLKSPLICEPGKDAFAIVEVFEQKIQINGFGIEDSVSIDI